MVSRLFQWVGRSNKIHLRVKNWFQSSTKNWNWFPKKRNKQLRISTDERQDSTRTDRVSRWNDSFLFLRERMIDHRINWERQMRLPKNSRILGDQFDWRESIQWHYSTTNRSILDRSSKWFRVDSNNGPDKENRERLEWSDWFVEIRFEDHTSSKLHSWNRSMQEIERTWDGFLPDGNHWSRCFFHLNKKITGALKRLIEFVLHDHLPLGRSLKEKWLPKNQHCRLGRVIHPVVFPLNRWAIFMRMTTIRVSQRWWSLTCSIVRRRSVKGIRR